MSAIRLALRQVGYTNRSFWRNPAAAFFTFAFPLVFLVILTSLFGTEPTTLGGQRVGGATFYIPAMAAFGLVTACYTNIAMSVSIQRDAGVLKRVRGTPMPRWSYLLGRATHGMLVGLLLVLLCAVFGALFYEVRLPSGADALRALTAVVVGGASFAALGLAATTIVPNAEAAPAVVNATILPVLFVSDVFINTDEAPSWVASVGQIFPVLHLVQSLQAAFLPDVVTWSWSDVLVVALWGVGGLAVAVRWFRWEPAA